MLEVDLKSGEKFSQAKILLLVVLPLLILVVGGRMAWMRAIRHAGRSWAAVIVKGALFLTTLALVAPILLAFAMAWKNTNKALREWFKAAPTDEWARRLLPDRFLTWLANSVSDNQWQLAAFYPLAAMVVILVVFSPAVRGFLQSRMARRAAVVSLTENARDVYKRAADAKITRATGELCSTAYVSVRDRIAARGR